MSETKHQAVERERKLKAANDRAMKRKRNKSRTSFASNRAIGVARRGKQVVEEVVEK